DRLAPFLIELAQQIRRVIRRHALEQSRGLLVRLRLEELDLVLGVELLEHVGGERGIALDRLDDLLALLMRRVLDDVRDLRRMQARDQPSSPGASTRSCACTIRPLFTSTRWRPSTSVASSTSPGRRWKASVRRVCVFRRTPLGSRVSMRSLPMNTSCAPTRTFRPVIGG